MNDIEFCVEYIKRTPRPLKNKTTIQMVSIVEKGQYVELEEMFNDDQVNELYIKNSKNNHVGAFVYKFIRDNQDSFINI